MRGCSVVSGDARRDPAIYGYPWLISGQEDARAAAIRCLDRPSWSSRAWAQTRSSTTTLWPAQAATCVGGTPAASHVDRQAWRRSYGRRAKDEASCSVVNAAARASCDFFSTAESPEVQLESYVNLGGTG